MRMNLAILRLFQSTLPVRGATDVRHWWSRFGVFQSTLPVRGATSFHTYADRARAISIHAPREGSDC